MPILRARHSSMLLWVPWLGAGFSLMEWGCGVGRDGTILRCITIHNGSIRISILQIEY